MADSHRVVPYEGDGYGAAQRIALASIMMSDAVIQRLKGLGYRRDQIEIDVDLPVNMIIRIKLKGKPVFVAEMVTNVVGELELVPTWLRQPRKTLLRRIMFWRDWEEIGARAT